MLVSKVMQEEGIDFEESFALVACLEAVRIFVHMLPTIHSNLTNGLDFRSTNPYAVFYQTAKYTLEILKKHSMEKGQSIGTLMATKPKLDADLSGEPIDKTDYRSKIGPLMYLTSSRPDIVQAVCYCAGYQARPTEKHPQRDKGSFDTKRYHSQGQLVSEVVWLELTLLSDADHAGCVDTRKSTSGGI
ncbi:retrovirus-related pol polyprotein from transposon TNT 1-94 [Tanacetum coccineum]